MQIPPVDHSGDEARWISANVQALPRARQRVRALKTRRVSDDPDPEQVIPDQRKVMDN
jgi:hypothetical protein